MRLLIAHKNPIIAQAVRTHAEALGWVAELSCGGQAISTRLLTGEFDLLLLHAYLPGCDGASVLDALARNPLVCPPRVLYLCGNAPQQQGHGGADCTASPFCTAADLIVLLKLLSKKPLPRLAVAQSERVSRDVTLFLDALCGMNGLKGRTYAAWMLMRLIPSPLTENGPLGELYHACAQHFGTTPSAVERCLRVAVESVFTQGSMQFIERFFGATVDPERGKPTNRAFLLQATQLLRTAYSRDTTRSPNKSEMHQRPAAPTMV